MHEQIFKMYDGRNVECEVFRDYTQEDFELVRQDTSTTNLAELDTPDWYRYSCAYDASMVSLKGTGYGSMACDASALQQNLLGDIAAINQTFLGIEWNDQTKQSLNQCRDHIARITAAEPEHNPGKHPYGEGRDVVDIYPALVGVQACDKRKFRR